MSMALQGRFIGSIQGGKKENKMNYTCPCCGYKTLDEQPPGTYEICSICFWEDDNIQYEDPDYEGGANIPSLRTAQNNYRLFGACEERCMEFVRAPNAHDEKDPHWKPVQ